MIRLFIIDPLEPISFENKHESLRGTTLWQKTSPQKALASYP